MRYLKFFQAAWLSTSIFIMGTVPSIAMMDNTQEETSKFTQINPAQQSTNRRETFLLEPYKERTTLDVLPDEILLTAFRFLDVDILGRVAQVSTRWKKITETPDLWRYIGARYYGDYLSKEDLREKPKQQVVFHYLSVIVNASESLEDIERLVRCYQVNLHLPIFRKYTNSITNSLILNHASFWNSKFFEVFFIQGNREIIERKMQDLYRTKGGEALGSEQRYQNGRKWNDFLIERGDPKAIERKILGLTSAATPLEVWRGYSHVSPPCIYVPLYGYEQDLEAARRFNDLLVENADPEAFERKLKGLLEGSYGYEKNSEKAREFNDFLIEREDMKAIERKIDGLFEGKYGYNKYPEDARDFNDFLVEKGDLAAIERKIEGLYRGVEGYKEDLAAAREFNEFLVEKGDQKAIQRKIEGLLKKDHGRNKNQYGYEKNPTAAREFNDSLIEKKGDPEAIKRKIEGLTEGKYGYENDPSAAREFIESLVMSEIFVARAIGKYSKAFAMKYGVSQLGYEQNREKAFKFIKENHVPY